MTETPCTLPGRSQLELLTDDEWRMDVSDARWLARLGELAEQATAPPIEELAAHE